MLRGLWALLALVVILLMVAPVAMAQDSTEEAPIVADVVDVAPDVVCPMCGGRVLRLAQIGSVYPNRQ